MRNRYIISITDLRGTRTINVHKAIKKIVIYVALITAIIIIIGFVTIKILISEVNSLDEKKDLIAKEYAKMLEKNEMLAQEMQLKKDELLLLTDKLEDLESLIGVDKKDESLSLEERVDIASITVAQKSIVLQLIPSGFPIDSKEISSGYGNRIHPVLKRPEFHTGTDIRAPINTPVRAAADGVIDYTVIGNNGGYGNTIVIDHIFGFKTIYGHLNKIVVERGTFVKKGEIIAYSGNSGLSSGPHLHYEVRFLNQHLDPMPFLDWNMANFEQIFNKERMVKWQSLLNMINRMAQAQAPLLSQVEQKSKEISR